MRGGNQIVALTECRETLESDEFAEAQRWISNELPKVLDDPAQWRRLTESPMPPDLRPANTVANFFESMGAFVQSDILDPELVCAPWSSIIIRAWQRLEPVIMLNRALEDNVSVWENFEFLAVLSQKWIRTHPEGIYPKRLGRMPVDAKWHRIGMELRSKAAVE